MDKEFIPYIEALALKELGFDESCFAYYSSSKRLSIFYNTQYSNRKNSRIIEVFNDHVVTAPLYQQAFRWFREKYNLFSSPTESLKDVKEYDWLITRDEGGGKMLIRFVGYHETYEEAELACIIKLIEIVKEK